MLSGGLSFTLQLPTEGTQVGFSTGSDHPGRLLPFLLGDRAQGCKGVTAEAYRGTTAWRQYSEGEICRRSSICHSSGGSLSPPGLPRWQAPLSLLQ